MGWRPHSPTRPSPGKLASSCRPLPFERNWLRASSLLPDSWSWEIRPIIDKQVGRYYLAFNPAFDRAWHGPGIRNGVVFSPALKVGYDFTRKINAGFEYYGSSGPVFGSATFHDQQHQFFAATDLNLAPQWEINLGVGVGVTASTDHLIVKGILGRRFDWSRRAPERAPSITH